MVHLDITPKQIEILILIYRFRFLNRIHIQTLLNYKDYRRINAWLRSLTDKQYLKRIYSRKLNENNKPAVYFLSSKSISVLKNQDNVEPKLLSRVYREHTRSQRFIKHSTTVADLCLWFSKQLDDFTVHFYTKTDLVKHSYLPQPLPDSYVAVEIPGATKRYFVDVIDQGTPRFAIRQRVQQHFEYFDEDIWIKHTGHPYPTTLFICPDQKTKSWLATFIREKLKDQGDQVPDFSLSLSQKIRKSDYRKNIWQKVTVNDD